MNSTIRIVWWSGLIGALAATLAILKEVALVLRALQDIKRLAEITHDAAHGIVENTEVISKLPEVAAPAPELRRSAASIAASAKLIEQRLGDLTLDQSSLGG